MAALICEKMGWTYQQYMDQPVWFLKTLVLKWSEEAQHNKEQHGNQRT